MVVVWSGAETNIQEKADRVLTTNCVSHIIRLRKTVLIERYGWSVRNDII